MTVWHLCGLVLCISAITTSTESKENDQKQDLFGLVDDLEWLQKWLQLQRRCGKSVKQSPAHHGAYVVGGQEARHGEWPWMVSMRFYPIGHWCGGSLIHDRWVLTAAHCFRSPFNDTSQWSLALGKHQAYFPEPDTEQVYSIEKLLTHPRYDAESFNNDIALIKLNQSVTFTDFVRPVCLNDNLLKPRPESEVVVTGWGDTQGTGNDLVLNKASVPVVSQRTCRRPDFYGSRITWNMLCAGYAAGGADSCFGDSGGPLVELRGNKWYEVGIVSWGSPGQCAQPKKPGVYSRVANYFTWIWWSIYQNRS